MDNFKNLTDKINFNEDDDLTKIEKLLFKYPYYQNLHAFYLKSLKNQKKYNYTHILKKTSILTLDRENLYNWLNKSINSKKNDNAKVNKGIGDIKTPARPASIYCSADEIRKKGIDSPKAPIEK